MKIKIVNMIAMMFFVIHLILGFAVKLEANMAIKDKNCNFVFKSNIQTDDPLGILEILKNEDVNKKEFLNRMLSCGVEQYKIDFANGIFLMHAGHVKDALRLFIDLSNKKNSTLWGSIGMLEYSLYTENISNMLPILEMLRESKCKKDIVIPDWVVPHYYSWYLWHHGDFDKLEKTLISFKDRLGIIDYFELKFSLFLHNDKFNEAEELIKELPNKFRNDIRVVISFGDLILLRHGVKEYIKWSREQIKKYPDSLELKQRLAYYLLEAGSYESGLKMYQQVVSKKPNDIYLKLEYLDSLIQFGLDYSKLYGSLKTLSSPTAFPYYNCLVAQIYYENKIFDKMNIYLQTALKLNNNYINALWIRFNYEKSIGDIESALATIQYIYKLYPNELEVLFSLMEIGYMSKDFGLYEKAKERLLNSKRFKSDYLLKRINSVVSKMELDGRQPIGIGSLQFTNIEPPDRAESRLAAKRVLPWLVL